MYQWNNLSYGSGYGSGFGDGYGQGYGESSPEFYLSLAATMAREIKDKRSGGVYAFWCSNADGYPQHGLKDFPRFAGCEETTTGDVRLCGKNMLHSTHHLNSWRENNSRYWLVWLDDPYYTSGDKLASQHRVILREVQASDLGL